MIRQEQIYSGNVAAGQTVNHTLARGHVNGLLFFGAAIGEGTITVKRRGDRCEVLAANLALRHVARISDVQYGGTSRSNALDALRALLITDHDGAGAGTAVFTAAQYKQYVLDVFGPQNVPVYYLDLGSIYLGTASDLELAITFTNAGAASIFSVEHDRAPDRMLQYDQVSDREGNHTSVEALFISAAAGAFLLNVDADGQYASTPDVSFHVEDDDGAYLTNLAGLVGAATVLGRTENVVQSQIARLYSAPSGIPSSVFLRVSGADAANVVVIARKAVFDADMVSRNTVAELRKLQVRLEKLEKADPAGAKALRHAGITEKSTAVAAMVAGADSPSSR